MKLQQLRYVLEITRRGNHLSAAAEALHTSQPGVSRQIQLLEAELGFEIFLRTRNRIIGLTPFGQHVVDIARRVVDEMGALRSLKDEVCVGKRGSLTIGTTHTQARYSLPKVVSEFKRRYPKVHLTMKQGSPQLLAEMVIAREADIAIATEALDGYPKLLALPGYEWSHCVVVPARHPLAKGRRLTLEELARHPIVTYDAAFAGRTHIDAAFGAQGLAPDIVLSAVDSDVIKTYVELGLGVGIIAAMAFDEERDRSLRALDAGHLFGTMTTRVAVRRGAALRGYAYTFIELFSPRLNRKLVETALAGKAEAYEL